MRQTSPDSATRRAKKSVSVLRSPSVFLVMFTMFLGMGEATKETTGTCCETTTINRQAQHRSNPHHALGRCTHKIKHPLSYAAKSCRCCTALCCCGLRNTAHSDPHAARRKVAKPLWRKPQEAQIAHRWTGWVVMRPRGFSFLMSDCRYGCNTQKSA